MPIEPELKFRIPEAMLGSVAGMRIRGARAEAGSDRKLVSTYFDTPKQRLRRHGLTLRVRSSDGEFRQTVKSAAVGGFERGEWEAKVSAASPMLGELKKTPLARLATKKLKRKLEPVFRTSVDRTARRLRVGTSEVELAVDRGTIVAGRRKGPISEFELELTKGRKADLFRLARQFEQRTGAELDLRSKAERGYLLARGDKRTAVRAQDIALTKAMTVGEAFDVIAFSTLRHFTSNVEAVRGYDSEGIHQMRVGLRRLRAAISLFGKILPPDSTERIKTELKWLTGELAAAREIDVFVTEKIEPLEAADAPQRGVRAIETEFAERRTSAFAHASHAIATPRCRRLPIDILEWLEAHRRRSRKIANAPIGEFAEDVMVRRIKKIRKEARSIEEMAPMQRHKLRIRIKKIRYAVDFFRSLYHAHEQGTLDDLSEKLKKGQDALGALNDFVAHRDMATDAALSAPRKDRRARAFASGLLLGQETEAAKELLKNASKAAGRLKPSMVRLD